MLAAAGGLDRRVAGRLDRRSGAGDDRSRDPADGNGARGRADARRHRDPRAVYRHPERPCAGIAVHAPTTGRSLIDGSRLTSATPERRRLRSLLVASEVAWTLMLLVGAGLMLNSFVRLVGVQPGFRTSNVLVLPVELPSLRYREASTRRQFQDQLLERLNRVPGVTSVGATSHLPLSGSDNWMNFDIVGRPAPPPGQGPTAAFRTVTPDYFRTLDIPAASRAILFGRDARLALPLIRWFAQQPRPEGFDRPQAMPGGARERGRGASVLARRRPNRTTHSRSAQPGNHHRRRRWRREDTMRSTLRRFRTSISQRTRNRGAPCRSSCGPQVQLSTWQRYASRCERSILRCRPVSGRWTRCVWDRSAANASTSC